MVEAIRRHHQPERTQSPHAALLYLTEHMLNSEEDLSSLPRLRSCLRTLRLEESILAANQARPEPALAALMHAA